MAELTFKSPGVSTKEIDLSGPTALKPQGVPAGIIGTANQGPAFVPITVATFADFQTYFGKTDGEKFGPLAMYEWMKNAKAGTYLRVLGIGDGKKRLTSAGTTSNLIAIPAGGVKNAGFIAGVPQVKANGYIGNNAYAYAAAGGGMYGRTYMLGAFMSDSNDSDYLTTAGIQTSASASIILRGVLLAPSGVLLALSGNFCMNAATASMQRTSGSWTSRYGGDGGGPVGSISCGGSTPDSSYNFVMLLNGHKNTEQYPNTITASLNPGKSNYISDVLNTDPAKIQQAGHLLYTHYDITTAQAVVTGTGILGGPENSGFRKASKYEEAVFLLTSSLNQNVGSSTIPNFENFSDRFQHAFSPTLVSQKIGGKNKNLFTVHALDDGPVPNTNIKISIENIKKSKVDDDYGKFDLIVRKFWDSDSAPSVVETGEAFRGLNLDPNSDDYIGRRIGNINTYFDFDKAPSAQKIVVDGIFSNKSRYIRVDVAADVANAEMEKVALPVGFRGPYHLVTSGSSIMSCPPWPLSGSKPGSGPNGVVQGELIAKTTEWGNRLVEPPIPYRLSISNGTGNKKSANSGLYWGWQNTRIDNIATPNASEIFNKGMAAFTKYYPKFTTSDQAAWVGANAGTLASDGTVYDSDKFNNNLFSLENIQILTKSSGDKVDSRQWGFASYRRNGIKSASIQDMSGDWHAAAQTRFLNVSKDFGDIASQKYYKFTVPVQGGFGGVNVFNSDKAKLLDNAAKREMDDSAQGFVDGPTVSAYAKALDVMAEKSDVDIQLLTIPGLREEKVTDIGIEKTEERFDALYIMDIEETDVSNNVVTSSIQKISVGNTVETLKSRGLDTSFAACYFPDVFITDPNTLTNVRVPPSVVVLGAMSLNDSVAFPWYAPAGFTRGALASTLEAKVKFNRNNLDALYETDINPITEFPTSPDQHVVWGQKTLLARASALDRVNVRRLLIDVRRKVRKVADTFIFEPNRESTLARFSAAVNPILAEIQAQQGVERFRVIIDATTTTQADVENNTVRGKIFLQPTRAVEFIALDFVITNNGTEI